MFLPPQIRQLSIRIVAEVAGMQVWLQDNFDIENSASMTTTIGVPREAILYIFHQKLGLG